MGDRVLVKPFEARGKSRGGIIIPDGAKERPIRGRVISVGPGKGHPESGAVMPMHVTVGDIVVYGSYAGTEMKVGDVEYLVMSEMDLLGMLRGDED